MVGGFLSTYLSEKYRIILLFITNSIGFSSLLGFFGEFYKSSFLRKIYVPYGIIIALIMSYLGYDYSWGNRIASIESILVLNNVFLMVAIVFGLIAGFIKWAQISSLGLDKQKYANIRVFVAVTCCYLLVPRACL